MLRSSVKGGSSLRDKTLSCRAKRAKTHILCRREVCVITAGKVGFIFKIHLIKGLILSGSKLWL